MSHTIDPAAFKAYDIRGVVPDQIPPAAAEQVGRAFKAMLHPKRAVIGRDVRLSSNELHGHLLDGLIRSGVHVIDVGVVSSDAFVYACATRNVPGIMITASHNPPEYNGFKLVKHVPDLVAPVDLKPFFNSEHHDATRLGSVDHTDVTDEFLDFLLRVVPAHSLKPLKVVVDTSNGAQGAYWKKLKDRLPLELTPLHWEPDGNFPNHGNDVIQPKNQEKLREKVLQVKADLGLIFDPDGDRCLLVDDRGVTVPGDFIVAFMSEMFLKRQKGSAIVYDVRSSDAVADTVLAAGGKPLPGKIGHAFIKPKMKQHDAIFGGEVSGHFYFKDFWFADCGLLAGLSMLQYASKQKGKLSDRVRQLESKYHLSGEINSKVADADVALAKVKDAYKDADIDELDGISVRYPEWRFVCRKSNTEPLVRLTLEAKSQELMEEKRDEVLGLIRS